MTKTPGERISARRAKQRLTQTALAKLIDKERQYVHGVERGRFVPKWPTMSKIATALKTTVDKLYGSAD
mgnify:CR=1 FL=1